MSAKTTIALAVGLVLAASTGLAAATYQGRSIWGTSNPGEGGANANMPDAAALHNHAGANHPFPQENKTHGNDTGDGNETGEDGNETGEGSGPGDDNGAGDDNNTGDANETGDSGNETGGQPGDVPPAHAQDGSPESGKPSDVPPAHAGAPGNDTA